MSFCSRRPFTKEMTVVALLGRIDFSRPRELRGEMEVTFRDFTLMSVSDLCLLRRVARGRW